MLNARLPAFFDLCFFVSVFLICDLCEAEPDFDFVRGVCSWNLLCCENIEEESEHNTFARCFYALGAVCVICVGFGGAHSGGACFD